MEGRSPLDQARRLFQSMCGVEQVMVQLRARKEHSSWEGQDAFVREVYNANPQWPGALQYRARVLKSYLRDVSDAHEEVHDELLALYLAVGTAAASRVVADVTKLDPNASERAVHRVYELADGTRVPLLERVEFNEVAEAIWPAGICLAEWLMQYPHTLRGLRVVELGCGVGVTAVFALKVCAPARMVLTDYSAAGLDFARENLALNGLAEDASTLVLQRVDWTQFSLEDAKLLGPVDVVIMADWCGNVGMREVGDAAIHS